MIYLTKNKDQKFSLNFIYMAYHTLRRVEFAFLSALIRMLEVPHTLAIYVPMYLPVGRPVFTVQ